MSASPRNALITLRKNRLHSIATGYAALRESAERVPRGGETRFSFVEAAIRGAIYQRESQAESIRPGLVTPRP